MSDYFKRACDLIKDMGFRVIVSKRDGANYGWISDGENIGYFQLEMDGISLSTCNKQPGSDLSGYMIEAPDGSSHFLLEQITKKDVEHTFLNYPAWVFKGHYELKRVVKYKNLDEFMRTHWDKDNLIEL